MVITLEAISNAQYSKYYQNFRNNSQVQTKELVCYKHIKRKEYMFVYCLIYINVSFGSYILGDPGVTANIYCKSRNPPNTDTQNYSTDLR